MDCVYNVEAQAQTEASARVHAVVNVDDADEGAADNVGDDDDTDVDGARGGCRRRRWR